MKIYSYALLMAAIVLVLHLIGLDGAYWKVPIYDVIMHMLGGAAVGLFLAAMVSSVFPDARFKTLAVIIITLAIGLAWELFEIRFGLTGHPVGSDPYYFDTIQDLINDTIGAVTVALAVFRR